MRLRRTIRRFRQRNGIYFHNGSGEPLLFTQSLSNGVVFDFRATHYIHFGDLMFFLPIMLVLAARTRVCCISAPIHRGFLEFLLLEHSNVNIIPAPADPGTLRALMPGFVITSPYMMGLDLNPWRTTPVIGLGLADQAVSERYPEYLANAFLDFSGIAVDAGEVRERTLSWCQALRHKALERSGNFDQALGPKNIWLAPYMGSGRFRDLFGRKKAALLRHANALARQTGASLLLAGGPHDPPVAFADVHLIDNRGASITDAMCLAASPKVASGVGFDGFWMHFFDILQKPYTVLFRGRYTRAARQLHYRSVNVSFCYATERVYLPD